MSLVNDALRRAKDAQKKGQPAAPSPQLRPAESTPVQKRGMGMIVPVIIAMFVVTGILVVLKNRPKTSAREMAPTQTAALPVNTIAQTQPPVPATPVTTPAPITSAAVAPTPAVAPAPAAIAPAPQLKLQAIFYTPGHSSAIISGKTVRVGNVFKGYRVAAITETSATLINDTQTNVMTLEQ